MPPQPLPPECYFAAFVYTPDGMARYFTLEHTNSNASKTMFCAWDAEWRHINFGDGANPNINGFVDAIGSRLRGAIIAT
ncbi:MAG: hypothetical protein WBX25_11065 [Rhodomicrobium sp.]